MNDLHFPPGFLWGTATAPVQNEGSFRESSWWAWERRPGAIRNGDRSGIGCNWWANAEADFDLARSMGHNALRLGVEWSRIQPQENVIDERALARYRQMLHGLRARGIETMLTLHHFSDPLWFAEQGGWENESAYQLFEKYVRRVVEALREYVTLWVTINEHLSHSELSPGRFSTWQERIACCPSGSAEPGARPRRCISGDPQHSTPGAGRNCYPLPRFYAGKELVSSRSAGSQTAVPSF